MWHFHHTSKLYRPIHLGEILQVRTFTAAREINPLAAKEKPAARLKIQDDALVQQEPEPHWEPRSLLTIIDGAVAIKWALILVEYGEEEEIETFIDWYVTKARSKPQRIEQLKALWDTAAWTIAMKMRAGETWGAASRAVMLDNETVQEVMAERPTKQTKFGNNNDQAKGAGKVVYVYKGDKGNHGKTKFQGKGSQWQQTSGKEHKGGWGWDHTPNNWSSSWQDNSYDNRWQKSTSWSQEDKGNTGGKANQAKTSNKSGKDSTGRR
jgi:hypothetical protein